MEKYYKTISDKILVLQNIDTQLATFTLLNETVTIPIPQSQNHIASSSNPSYIAQCIFKMKFMPIENGVWSILMSRLGTGV